VLLLTIFVVSMVLGVIAGIALTKKLLESYSQTLYFAIMGFIAGSLFIIYPGFSADLDGVLSVLFALLSAYFAYWLSNKGE